jgi:hypothetical protein
MLLLPQQLVCAWLTNQAVRHRTPPAHLGKVRLEFRRFYIVQVASNLASVASCSSFPSVPRLDIDFRLTPGCWTGYFGANFAFLLGTDLSLGLSVSSCLARLGVW